MPSINFMRLSHAGTPNKKEEDDVNSQKSEPIDEQYEGDDLQDESDLNEDIEDIIKY